MNLHDVSNEAQLHHLVKTMMGRGVDSEQALSSLYDLTASRVVRLVRRFVSEAGLVSEVTQDTFFQAWNQADRFDFERGSVLAWLLTIARSRALDACRKQGAQPVVFDGDMADALLEIRIADEPTPDKNIELWQEGQSHKPCLAHLEAGCPSNDCIGLFFRLESW